MCGGDFGGGDEAISEEDGEDGEEAEDESYREHPGEGAGWFGVRMIV